VKVRSEGVKMVLRLCGTRGSVHSRLCSPTERLAGRSGVPIWSVPPPPMTFSLPPAQFVGAWVTFPSTISE